ncbi:MAG: hypothetical protein HY590_07920 [Candidatus Omnitrophica bacterium]|nr:hypothetical protein [Candidatus Omnitrophota bacterium]
MKGSFDRFRQIVLSQIPRLLGLGDRDPFSETYGCFDRVFWHYRLIDFPNARFQEACWPLSLLYRHSFEGNLYYQNEKVRQWTEAAIRFWASHRHRDGSLDEAYPNERGFCVTAFSTFAVTEAMLLLQIRVPNLEKTGRWLLGHDQPFVANQMAASAVALLNLYQLTNEKRYLRASQERISTLLSSQDETGFFPEYGGADIGYLSLTLACLAHYWRQTKEGPLWESMGRALKFLEERVEEDGHYDYRQTSRKTQFLYSYGLAISDSPPLERLTQGLEQGTLLNPVWLDDRYFIQLTTDYLETYLLSWESRR